jgi:hypothetical protein
MKTKRLLAAFVSLLVLAPGAPAGPKGSAYVNLKSKPMWSFDENQRTTIVLVRNTEKMAGRECSVVEWHYGQVRPAPFVSELWYEKGDSIFCAGMKAFGASMAYPRPVLVVANSTKPGDTWSVPTGSGPICDTLHFTVEAVDTLDKISGKIAALRIKRTSRATVLRRWFAKGQGLVKESKDESGDMAPLMLK